MTARTDVPSALASARAYGRSHPDTWGGMWLTYPVASTLKDVLQVNVGTIGDTASMRRSLAGLIPPNVHLVVKQVANREVDLDAIVDKLASGSDVFSRAGVTYLGAGTTVEDNVVDIDVSSVTPEVTAAAESAFGAGKVRVVQGTPAVADACNSRLDCGPPWAGGMRIEWAANADCTAGFGVSFYNGIWNYGMFTAGHCGGHTWHEGTVNGTVIGTSTQVHFGNNLPADVQVIPFGSSAAYNEYIDAGAGCSPCLLRSITVTQGHDADGAGDAVCNHGAFSGTKCEASSQRTTPSSGPNRM